MPGAESHEEVAEPVVKPGSVVDNHSSRPCLAARLKQRTRVQIEPIHCTPIWPCSGWGLPCPAALAPQAVGSYPTVSPLPRTWSARLGRLDGSLRLRQPSRLAAHAVRRFVFCCTFRRLAPPRRYLAPCSMEPGLSSARSSRDAVVLTDSATAIVAPKPRAANGRSGHASLAATSLFINGLCMLLVDDASRGNKRPPRARPTTTSPAATRPPH